jgi:hypothetical protein
MVRERRQGQIASLARAVKNGTLAKAITAALDEAAQELEDGESLDTDQVRLLNTLSALLAT